MFPRLSFAAVGAALVSAALACDPATAKTPAQAPPLPPPDPDQYEIVVVDSAQELADACWNLESHQAIVIEPGLYDLASVDFPNGVDGRLTVGRFGAPSISDIQIRGATGDPADVVIVGAGMLDPVVPFGFQTFTATDVLIADLSIGDVYYHAVSIQGEQGAARIRLYHTRLFDAGQQIVKGTSGGGQGAADVVIELSEMFLTNGAVAHPQGSPPGTCYTNGIDALAATDWIIRDNVVSGIRCQNGALAGPAILLWGGSQGSLIERNTILDSSRGISLGLLEGDHQGGIVRNNFLRWNPDADYAVDVAIYSTSSAARILHNTILTHDLYQPTGGPIAIEVRFGSTAGSEVARNLMDGTVWLRNGAAPLVSENYTAADPQWFVDEASGDLRLLGAAAPAIDQTTARPDASDDFDAHPRPSTPNAADLGASEYGVVFADGFESGTTAAWSALG